MLQLCSVFPSLIHSPEFGRVWDSGAGWIQDGSTHLRGAAEDEGRWRVGWRKAWLADPNFHQAAFCFLTLYPLFLLCFHSRCLCVMKLLENMATIGEEMRDKMSRCAFYLSLLLKLARQKSITRKCEYCLSFIIRTSNGFHTHLWRTDQLWFSVHIYSWAGGRLSSRHSKQTVQNIHCGDVQQRQVWWWWNVSRLSSSKMHLETAFVLH